MKRGLLPLQNPTFTTFLQKKVNFELVFRYEMIDLPHSSCGFKANCFQNC